MIAEKVQKTGASRIKRVLLFVVLAIPALILVIAVIINALGSLAWGVILYAAIWITWKPRSVLFVYSDSPNWKDYLQSRVFPRIGDRLLLLNWSQRKAWRPLSLVVLASRHFGMSQRKSIPGALVFVPFSRVKAFHFYAPFKDLKHGDSRAVERVQADLFAALSIP